MIYGCITKLILKLTAEAIDRWFENIQRYEQMLEEVAAASLDQGFKDELCQINQWLRCRSDAERTATLYTIVQNASQIQIRFLITVLQQLASSNNDPYPAGQDTSSCGKHTSPDFFLTPTYNAVVNEQQQYQQAFNNSSLHANNPFATRSVISENESRKRQLYPLNRIIRQQQKGAMSEPDDLRRRNRDLFVSRPLGLSHPGPLYEKALQARAQLQAMNHGASTTTSSTTNSTLSTSSSSSLTSNGNTGGLFASPPRLRTSLSTTDLNPTKSLFSTNDWPFPLNSKPDDAWSFGNKLQQQQQQKKKPIIAKKEDLLPWAIQEEDIVIVEPPTMTTPVLSPLEQAQQKLKSDMTPTYSFLNVPPPHEESDDESDSEKEKPLTGLARRRKRSSAARALKDKLAAETVDFDLMKGNIFWDAAIFSCNSKQDIKIDVQDWLRSLRLHKYGHAFIGLDWKQVVRMSDQDMIDAGVNTIGARRKLLKVFENVQRHCIDNVSEKKK